MLIVLLIAVFGLGFIFSGWVAWSSAREVLDCEGYRVEHHREAPIDRERYVVRRVMRRY